MKCFANKGSPDTKAATRPFIAKSSYETRPSQHFFSVTPAPQKVQAKLKVGEANDVFEQEANRIADQVVGGGDTASVVSSPLGHGHISRTPSMRLQRRTADPIRSDRTRTFTYPLEVYTVDAQSHAEAKAVRDTLNAFEGTILDHDTMQEYTVLFLVRVFPPPDPDVLEKALGVRLHYRYGKQRLKKRAYQMAAQRYLVKVLSQPGNRQNLYLGRNRPVAETRQYIKASAEEIRAQVESDTIRQYSQDIKNAEQAGSSDEADRLRTEYHQKLDELRSGEASVQTRLDDPEGIQGSLGTSFPGGVIQMRQLVGSPGTEAYQHNVRLHEFMHLLGRQQDLKTLQQTVMSYPFLNKRKATDDVLTPQPDDIEALVRKDNPPPSP